MQQTSDTDSMHNLTNKLPIYKLAQGDVGGEGGKGWKCPQPQGFSLSFFNCNMLKNFLANFSSIFRMRIKRFM